MSSVSLSRRCGAMLQKLAMVGSLAIGCLLLFSSASASAASIDLPAGTSTAEVNAIEVSSYQDDFDVSRQIAEEHLDLQADGVGIVEHLQDSQGKRYAGVWFDNQAGEFVVPIVQGADRSSIANTFAYSDLGGDFRTITVERTWEELEATQTRIDRTLLPLIEAGLLQTHLDPAANAVIVTVAGEASDSQGAEIQATAEREGGSVDVIQGEDKRFGLSVQACVQAMYCDAPMRGGVGIQPKGSTCCNPDCTAGFKATGKTFGNRFMMTAGHCIVGTGASKWISYTTSQNPTEAVKDLGTVEAYTYPNHDWAVIKANNTYWDKPSWPTIVAEWGVTQERPITAESESYVGQLVCHSGSKSGAVVGVTCGNVTRVNVTEISELDGVVYGLLYDLTEFANICALPGDSGGPVFAGNTALGIFSSTDAPKNAPACYYNGYYNEITEATDALGVSVAPRVPPPPSPPIQAAFVDAGNGNSISAWQFDTINGWQQTFLWGHPVAAGTRPFLMKYEGTTHILFVDAARGNQITEWSWSPTLGWQQTFLNTDPVAPGSSLTGFVQSGYPQIFFSNAANNRSITALVRIGSAWYPANFYGDPVATNSSPTAILNNGQPQVYFADSAKGNTMAAWTWNSVSGWQQTFFYGDPVAANSSPSAISNNGQAQVYFVDSAKGNTIAAWTWGGSIQQSFFYGDSVAPNSSPSAISANGTPHIYFADGSKNNTVAVWVWTPASLKQTFFYGDSVAANSSPSALLTSGGKDQIFFSDENTNRSLALWEWGSTLQQSRLYGHLAVAGTSPGA